MSSNKQTTFVRTYDLGAPAFFLMVLQGLLLAILAVLIMPYGGRTIAYSVALGGSIYLVPALYFTYLIYRHRPDPPNARSLVVRFYFGEAQKFLLTGALFTLCFVLIKPLDALALFGAYGAMWILHMAGLIYLCRSDVSNKDHKELTHGF